MSPMLSIYALFVAEDAPSEAIQWSERIEDAEDRAKVQVLVARKWRESDPTAAESWIEQSSLSEDDRTAARKSRPAAAPR